MPCNVGSSCGPQIGTGHNWGTFPVCSDDCRVFFLRQNRTEHDTELQGIPSPHPVVTWFNAYCFEFMLRDAEQVLISEGEDNVLIIYNLLHWLDDRLHLSADK